MANEQTTGGIEEFTKETSRVGGFLLKEDQRFICTSKAGNEELDQMASVFLSQGEVSSLN